MGVSRRNQNKISIKWKVMRMLHFTWMGALQFYRLQSFLAHSRRHNQSCKIMCRSIKILGRYRPPKLRVFYRKAVIIFASAIAHLFDKSSINLHTRCVLKVSDGLSNQCLIKTNISLGLALSINCLLNEWLLVKLNDLIKLIFLILLLSSIASVNYMTEDVRIICSTTLVS
jgi:hypothetical protein